MHATSSSSAASATVTPSLPSSVPHHKPMATTSSSSTTGMQSVVAGVVAGCVTRSCTSPLDVLKIIIQVNGSVTNSTAAMVRNTSVIFNTHVSAASALRIPMPASQAGPPSVMLRTVRELYSMDGLRAFWRGNIAGCCRLGPYAGAKFFLFDTLQSRFLDENPSNVQRAMCGATAGLFATMGTYPLEIVRTRMITQTAANTLPHMHIRGVAHGVKLILRHEGLRGLYKGGWSGVVGAIPFEGVQFGCYEYLKFTSQQAQWPAFRWPEGKQELDGVDFFVCGSIAGAIAQTVAYPFDTVKKRLQTQVVVGDALHFQTKGSGKAYYRGMCDCFKKVIQEEGLMALYRGTVPNLARIVPYAAVMFSTFEMTKKSLRLLCDTAAC